MWYVIRPDKIDDLDR
uniref:Uncharacterized protein n=1 Tax=Rhizophora mucronata TaxID=61149 RepID=A0A2P2QI28_RHIMU